MALLRDNTSPRGGVACGWRGALLPHGPSAGRQEEGGGEEGGEGAERGEEGEGPRTPTGRPRSTTLLQRLLGQGRRGGRGVFLALPPSLAPLALGNLDMFLRALLLALLFGVYVLPVKYKNVGHRILSAWFDSGHEFMRQSGGLGNYPRFST